MRTDSLPDGSVGLKRKMGSFETIGENAAGPGLPVSCQARTLIAIWLAIVDLTLDFILGTGCCLDFLQAVIHIIGTDSWLH
jgi:hypothetical protein